ncbi:sensor histidine kinase [Dechloromonas sp. XY25]|uniref:histidine kinase n=1 Tax=Dechloromonas hankyongensis TaxID=2908002 RepID=A0ABS9K160_9RHOO|nr:sensor histidine kinase [Dechloromonas hankyongensis]MCG2576912.1 sensor histidine kinase [Dechloromonas hankyongensis]
MDLRRRLIGSLSLLLASLMAIAVIIQLYSLRADIASEVGASTRLVGVLLAAENAALRDPSELAERLSEAGIRHLTIRTPEQAPAERKSHLLLDWLGHSSEVPDEQEIRIGGQTLYIAANPNSEIEERLGDTARILITLLLFSGATLLVVWWSADRALSPVRALEDALHGLARSEKRPVLPGFALREFRRVADAIDYLADALGEARAAQHALAQQLISVQENERRALARELHDEMGQTLTSLNATAAHLARNAQQLAPEAVTECANDLRRDIRTSGAQLRALLKSLRPHGLDASGLASTLRDLIDGWRSRETGITFELDLPAPFPDVDEEVALTIYRIAQEALTNVVRHSGASVCRVSAVRDGEWVRLAISDDGHGLPQDGPKRRRGLLGIAERLDMVGGKLQLEPNAGGGLYLSAWLPLAQVGNDLSLPMEAYA